MGVKQTIKLKPGYTKADASKKVLDGTHGARYLYACTNKNVATVDAKGRIKAKAAGKCTVYVIACKWHYTGCADYSKIKIVLHEVLDIQPVGAGCRHLCYIYRVLIIYTGIKK